MIDSPVLRTSTRFAVPITVVISLVIFWQGHNLPGGGFVAGVMAASAGAMHLLAFGVAGAARVPWWRMSVVGLLITVVTGTVPLLGGFTYMDHGILDFRLPLLGHLHVPTATFFDLGVYLVVLGTLMTIFVELGLEEH
jgi:multisubunit Na+/H+ antiporter MnhB subunit